jgi:hypothetical protein
MVRAIGCAYGQAEAGPGNRQRKLRSVNTGKLIRLSYIASCSQVVATYGLVSGAALRDHHVVSDFVHPNNNLEARTLRAFFVL